LHRFEKMTENEINELWKNPRNWRVGFVYYCKEDPRVIVPKRIKIMGWTLNFANLWAIPTLILMIVGVLAPFKILALFAPPEKSLWLLITILFVLIGLCLFCFIMASPRRYAKRDFTREHK
jgi:uncharacterized membrane protein